MKKHIALKMFALLALMFSCQSTKQTANQPAKKSSAPTQAVSQREASRRVLIEQLSDMMLTIESSPPETIRGKPFSSPYTVYVSHLGGSPYSHTSIVVEYPASRTSDQVSYAKESLFTDEEGKITFMPPTPEKALLDEVKFYPNTNSRDNEVVSLIEKLTVTSPYKVKTNVASRTGILVSIVDYDRNGKIVVTNGSQPSTQALEKFLWRGGLMGAQNADFHNSIDADDVARIRSDALKLVRGNTNFRYVIFGRVKYATPIVQDDTSFFTASFDGDIGALDMRSGEVLVRASKTVNVRDRSQRTLVTRAQEEMAKLFADEIFYGL